MGKSRTVMRIVSLGNRSYSRHTGGPGTHKTGGDGESREKEVEYRTEWCDTGLTGAEVRNLEDM